MGHADRDFLQESREDEWKHRGPFSSRERPATSIATISFVLIALACFAYFALGMWSGRVTTTATPPPSTTPASQRAAAPRNPPQSAMPAPQNTTAVIKCVINGMTTYVASHRDCPAHAQATTVMIDPRQNLSDGLPNAAQIIRRPSPFVAPEPTAPHANADPNVQRKSICHAYDEQIKSIDARARQPLPPQEQDRLTAERKNVRDAQFRLQCYLVTGF
jgi:hypothetical protein